jgi:hypothetical protein
VIIVDTDALGHLQKRDPIGIMFQAQLDASADRDLRITSVTAYEMVGGAVDLIDRRKRQRRDVIPAFRLLQELVEYLGLWRGLILSYDGTAEGIYRGLSSRLRQELVEPLLNPASAGFFFCSQERVAGLLASCGQTMFSS